MRRITDADDTEEFVVAGDHANSSHQDARPEQPARHTSSDIL